MPHQDTAITHRRNRQKHSHDNNINWKCSNNTVFEKHNKNWLDLTISYAPDQLTTCHNCSLSSTLLVFKCQMVKCPNAAEHTFTYILQWQNKQRAVQTAIMVYYYYYYYNQLVKSHSCSEVNGDLSSEVALTLIKSEETTGSSGKYSCRPPPTTQQHTLLHRSVLYFPPPAPVSEFLRLHNASFSLWSTPHRGIIGRILIEKISSVC